MADTVLPRVKKYGLAKNLVPQVLVPEKISEAFKGLAKAGLMMDRKEAALAGATGMPIGGVEFGAGEGDGYYRRYQNGIMYLKPPGGPCWVHGSILDKYRSLGAEGGFLGYPTTDELTTAGGAGRYNHFERGSIYWEYNAGAHAIHGAIRDKWASLGWEQSSLGFPTSDELEFTEEGRVSTFQRGSIYWWHDTGAIDLGNVAVRYKGLYCFGETDEASAADEPYVTFGVVSVPPDQKSAITRTEMTPIYDDVDAGDSRPDTMELYRGMPGGIALGLSLMEHDSGNRDEYLDQIKEGVALLGKGVSLACGALFGPEAAPICASVWTGVSSPIVKFANDIVGSEDDLIGKWASTVTAKEMVTRARGRRHNFWGIEYQWESGLVSDGEASYKVYFDVVAV